MSVFDVRAPLGPGGGAPPGPVLQTSNIQFLEAVDGDTYVVKCTPALRWDEPIIRLKGVDCPELGGPDNDKAVLAKTAVETFCLGQTVDLDFWGTDPYGRCVASVSVSPIGDLGEWLLAEGLAGVYPDDYKLPYYTYNRSEPPWRKAKGPVTDVIDGDTMRVAVHGGLTYATPTVRCARIDCPELGGEYAGIAFQALSFSEGYALGKKGTLTIYGSDVYGRVVADVTITGSGSLGSALVTASLASWYPPPFGLDLFPGEDTHLKIELG